MARTPLEFDPAAVEEAERSRAWYSDRSPGAARRYLAELSHAFEQIADAPERWPSYLHGTRRYVCRRFPFSVIYRIFPDRVYVVAIAHFSQEPGYWASR